MIFRSNKMNCELMLTYDTPALQQTGSRNLTGQKTLPTIWERSDIWSQASYRYPILWKAFLDPSHSYVLFADLVGFYSWRRYNKTYNQKELDLLLSTSVKLTIPTDVNYQQINHVHLYEKHFHLKLFKICFVSYENVYSYIYNLVG
jgi:hypothetical protein